MNTNSLDLNTIKRVLVIQLGPFGDVLLTTSYFEQLKREYPHLHIAYLVKQPYQRIVKNHPFIDEIITIKKATGLNNVWERLKTVRTLRKKHFELVIDQQNMPSTQQLSWLSGIPNRLGYANARLAFLYTIKAGRGPARYSALRKYDILTPLGITDCRPALHYPINPESFSYIDDWKRQTGVGEHFIVMSPSSPVVVKRWPRENWVELCHLLIERNGLEVLLLWGPGEEEFCRSILVECPKGVRLCPPTDFNQAAALMVQARLFMCNDGGINHVAAAVKARTLALFGSTSPVYWSPAAYTVSHHHAYNRWLARVSPDFGLTPEMIWQKVQDLIDNQSVDSSN